MFTCLVWRAQCAVLIAVNPLLCVHVCAALQTCGMCLVTFVHLTGRARPFALQEICRFVCGVQVAFRAHVTPQSG